MTVEIRTGFWHDYSSDGVLSSTWTVKVTMGSIIISALATFIALLGSRFWAIIAFVIHQWRSTDEAKDGLHHQHQLLYRNGSSHLATAWEFIRLSVAWRRRAPHNLRRTLLSVVAPLLCFGLFATAGIFSARVAAPSYSASHVLVAPKNCGFLNFNSSPIHDLHGILTSEAVIALSKHLIRTALEAQNYARTCYAEVDDGSQRSCGNYPTRKLPYTVADKQPCPFAGARCKLGKDTAFQLATPWLNSHDHFGINAPPKNRVEIRRSSVCSVLNIDDLLTIVPDPTSSKTYYGYAFGPTSSDNTTGNFTAVVIEEMQNMNLQYVLG